MLNESDMSIVVEVSKESFTAPDLIHKYAEPQPQSRSSSILNPLLIKKSLSKQNACIKNNELFLKLMSRKY